MILIVPLCHMLRFCSGHLFTTGWLSAWLGSVYTHLRYACSCTWNATVYNLAHFFILWLIVVSQLFCGVNTPLNYKLICLTLSMPVATADNLRKVSPDLDSNRFSRL